MHSIFAQTSPSAQGVFKLPEWIYIKNGLTNNLNSVLKFYRLNPMAVKSDHFLVSLLQSITIPQSQNLERYYNNVDSMALNLSMAFKMTSSIYRGKLFNGIFLGKGNDEILIASDEPFDPFEAEANWKDLRPVNFLRHFRSDLTLNIPDGSNTSSEEGLSVVVINIPLLAVQYRAFRINEIKDHLNGDNAELDTTKSCMQFIHMYVLPNSLYSFLDHAMFNRIVNLEFGIPLGESSKAHSFFLTDYSAKVIYAQNNILNLLRKQNRTFDGILQNIPMIVNSNADDLMELPDLPLTHNVLWGMVMARIPELKFLFRISKESIGDKNRSDVNRIFRYITMYKHDNLFRQTLPLDQFTDLMDDLNEIVEYAK